MRKFLMIGAAAAALFATQAAFAETPVGADKQSAIAVTIYNDDLALVKDARTRRPSTQGDNGLAFIDVSARHAARDRAAAQPAHGRSTSRAELRLRPADAEPSCWRSTSAGPCASCAPIPTTGAETDRETPPSCGGGRQSCCRSATASRPTPPGRLVFGGVPPNLRDRPTLVTELAQPAAPGAGRRALLPDAAACPGRPTTSPS